MAISRTGSTEYATVKSSLLDQINAAAAAGVEERERAENQARQETERRRREDEERVKQAIARLVPDAEIAGRAQVPYIVLFEMSAIETKQAKKTDLAGPAESSLGEHQIAVLTRCRELGLNTRWVFCANRPGHKGVDRWEMQIPIERSKSYNVDLQGYILERIVAERRKKINDPTTGLSEHLAIAYLIGSAARLEDERRADAENDHKRAEAEARAKHDVDATFRLLLRNIHYASQCGSPHVVVFSVSCLTRRLTDIDPPAESSLTDVQQSVIRRLRMEQVRIFWRFESNEGLRQLPEWQLCVPLPKSSL